MFSLITGNIVDIELPEVDCIITSPPYYRLRDYKHKNQIGQEKTVKEYVENLINVFNKIPLKETGTLFLNLGDSYINGCLAGVPWKICIGFNGFGVDTT